MAAKYISKVITRPSTVKQSLPYMHVYWTILKYVLMYTRYEEAVKHGRVLTRIYLVWIQTYSSPRLVAKQKLKIIFTQLKGV